MTNLHDLETSPSCPEEASIDFDARKPSRRSHPGGHPDAPATLASRVSPPPGPGRWVDRYLLLHRVAVGGMGEVQLALRVDGEFRRWVAVKLIHREIVGRKRYVEMFRNEARLAARLEDPHLCSVYDFGVDPVPYLVMECLHGQPLSAIAKRAAVEGGLSPTIAARIVADAARGLAAAHAHKNDHGEPQPVVHRDVSPQNIFVLYSGLSKVVDFGIARPVDDDGEFTRTGEVKGKLAYMAPEQLRGDAPDPRMDIWALGVVLWELALGRALFRRTSSIDTAMQVISEEIPTPSSVRGDFPFALEVILGRALERDPAKRYASALDMARDLEVFASGEAADARDAVSEYLASRFADERREREALMRELARTVPDSAVPTRERMRSTPAAIYESSRVDVRTTPSLDSGHSHTPSEFHQPSTARAKHTLVASLAGLGVLLTVAGLGLARSAPDDPQRASTTLRDGPAPFVAVRRAPPETPELHRAARPHATAPHTTPRVASALTPALPAPVAPSANGRLSLRSTVAGTVYSGARRLGHTPLVSVSLPSGEHHLRIVPDDPSDATQEVSVDIEPGAESTVALREGR